MAKLFDWINRSSAPDKDVVSAGTVINNPKSTDAATATGDIDAEGSSAPPRNDIAATTIDDIIRIEEVIDAEFFIGDLFRRKFGGDPPDYPKSFVAFYRPELGRMQAVGFVHYLKFEDSYMCGGLTIDDRLYRRMPPDHRRLVRDAGGIAEKLLRDTFVRLTDAPAIWGYVGDAQAEKVDLRVGFRHTGHDKIMVVWNHELSEAEKGARLDRVVAFGPF